MSPVPVSPSRSPYASLAAGCVLLVLIVLVPVFFAGALPPAPAGPGYGAGQPAGVPDFPPFTPVFTDPADKLAETKNPEFSTRLYREAVTYDPLLATPGTQVHMGFWSGRGNHGSLVVLLDGISDYPASATTSPQRAIWDEGVTSQNQYPSYVAMLNEHWYDRAYPVNGSVIVMGRQYTDPHPVTLRQADAIWGQYSQRYAGMAWHIANATGRPVKVWCFVEGARPNRLFYTYELPELHTLEEKGVVTIHFAKTRAANWTRAEDWILGSGNITVPAA